MSNYNWWKDPANKERVEKLSWWNHPENQTMVEIPVAIIQDGKYWIVSSNDETKKFLGNLGAVAQGDTKDEALRHFFTILQMDYDHNVEERMKFSRWVPLKIGPWKSIGGKWFSVFGIHVSFRYGDGMKGGWYVPFTKLNISMHSEWAVYRNCKRERQ